LFSEIEFKISRVLLLMIRDGEIDNAAYCKISRLVNAEMESFVINEMNGFVYKKKRKNSFFSNLRKVIKE
jgi:hypothetical protein